MAANKPETQESALNELAVMLSDRGGIRSELAAADSRIGQHQRSIETEEMQTAPARKRLEALEIKILGQLEKLRKLL